MFPGYGLLPFSRASFMLDFVALAMVAIIPVMAWSIWIVKHRRAYQLHKTVQLILGVLLLVTVVVFEIDVRVYGWKHLAKPSPHYDTILFPVLYVHLFFSITTTLLWIYTIVGALKHFDHPVRPNAYSRAHRKIGKLAAVFMTCTALTGWLFYYLAFVAS